MRTLSALILSALITASTIPFNNGAEASGSAAVMKVDPTDWLRECVAPYKAAKLFEKPFFGAHRHLDKWSNLFQLAMPHGLCSDALSCAFERCEWSEEADAAMIKVSDLSKTTFDQVSKHLPPLNLPAHIGFPKSVAQLVKIVKAANANSQKISVKTGGHSYFGSHTWKGSVQVNMRSFPKYSASSVRLCDTADDMVCKLARARKKKAVVRVGGGELWDEVYRAVIDWNTKAAHLGLQVFELVGGAAGSVSAAGGWLQGGGLGTHNDRLFGYGVDQVPLMPGFTLSM